MRILFALPGLHRVRRGAEVAFESIAQHLALGGGHEVTLFGSGRESPPRAYRFQRVPAVARSRFVRWPKAPLLRHEETYEAGDAYYAPPGHLPTLYAGSQVVEFSPTTELQQTMAVVEKNMASAGE